MTTQSVVNVLSNLDSKIEEAQKRITQAQERKAKEAELKRKMDEVRSRIEEKDTEISEVMSKIAILHALIGELVGLGDNATDLKKDKNAAVIAVTELKKDKARLESELSKLMRGGEVRKVVDMKPIHKPNYINGFVNVPKVVSSN